MAPAAGALHGRLVIFAARPSAGYMLASAVEAMCRAVDTAASDDEAAKRQKRIWRRLCGLVKVVKRRQGREPIGSATAIRPAHWDSPEVLTADDPCRAATDPAAWVGDCCHTAGVWRVHPGLPVPEEGWAATVLHNDSPTDSTAAVAAARSS